MSAYHFFFLRIKKRKIKKNNTHASACIIQRGGSRRPKNEGRSVWLRSQVGLYAYRKKEQPKRNRGSCCSDEYLKMPAAHGRRTDADMSKVEILSSVRLCTRDVMDSFWFFFFFHRLDRFDSFFFFFFSFLIFVALDMKKGMREKNKHKMGCAGKITPPRQGLRAPQR